MKIRIKGNSIRLRLSQTEVANFAKSGICQDRITFGNTHLSYRLKSANTSSLTASYNDDLITVFVNQELAEKWATNDSEVSLSHNETLTTGEHLYILVEKDFACLTPREMEDESDNFPNPNKAC